MMVWLATTSMGIGGAERLVVTLARGMADRGHDVLVWGRAGPLDRDLVPTPAGRCTVAIRPAGVDAVRFRHHLRQARPEGGPPHPGRTPAGAAAARGARGGRPRLVTTFHGVDATRLSRAGRVLRRADAVAAVSTDLGTALAAHGVPAGSITVIPTAAPPPPTVAPGLAAELRPGDGPLLVSVGRLVPAKNHARFLDAVTAIAARHPDVRALIVGDGPDRRAREARAAALGLGPRVRFLGWRADAPAIAAIADVAVFSSDSEGRSIAVLEALSAGTPVVTTPAPGMRELLAAGGGIVTDEPSADQLAAAVSGLLDDPAGRAVMGVAATAAAAATSTEAMLDAYEQLYGSSHSR